MTVAVVIAIRALSYVVAVYTSTHACQHWYARGNDGKLICINCGEPHPGAL